MRQNVRIIPIERPDHRGKRWSATLRRRCIIENETRNRRIVKEAREHVERGLKVVVIARFHDHINMLVEGMLDEGLDVRPITGKHSQEERADLVDEFNAGRIQVLIGTVIGEGVDIPSIEVVINAEGGKDAKATIQRQRNLTISDGKQEAVLIDFLDRTNEIFEKHSKERIAVYKSEPAFTVEQLTG